MKPEQGSPVAHDPHPEGHAEARPEGTPPEPVEESGEEAGGPSVEHAGDQADEHAGEQADHQDVEAAPSPEPLTPNTGSIRVSQPTPTLPTEARDEHHEAGLSEFFDTLDDRFAEATGKIAAVFRRPEPGEQISTRVDDRMSQGLGADQLVGTDTQTPDEPELTDAETEDPDPGGLPFPAQLPDRLEEDSPEDVDLPDAQTASQLAAYEEQTQFLPPVPGTGPGAQPGMKPGGAGVEEQPDDQATRRAAPSGVPPIALPKPPRRDPRPLPWEAQEAEETRRQDASAARRRAVILEKAAAIEAATGQEEPDPEQFADDEEDLYTYFPPYNLPSRDPDPAPRPHDLIRQIYVSLGAVAAVVSALWMLGIFNGPAILGGDALQNLVEGWYSGERALLTPDANHYWLWPLICFGLLGHAVHQWTTSQISTPRQRRSGWLVGTASFSMLAWTAAVHAGLLTIALLAALATALALIDAIRQFTFHTARTMLERRLTDAVIGLFTGWALVGGMSSISAWLTATGVHIPGFPAILWAITGLIGCIWLGAFYAMTERGRMTIALGMGWGMFWLVFPRLLSEVPSVWVAIGAAMGAFIVILATESRRHRINHAERRAAMGRPVDDII